MNSVEIGLIILLVVVISAVAIAYADAEDLHYKTELTKVDQSPVYVQTSEDSEPQELIINVEYNYIPTPGYECLDQIMPDDVVNLDEFNQIACMLAKTLYGEARGLSKYDQSLVCWCVFNRYDNGRFGDTLADVITAKNQFYGYKAHHPVDDNLYKLAVDCLLRWQAEKYSVGDVGRTLPKEYLYFSGDGKRNWYRTAYEKSKRKTFQFDTRNPYSD